MAVFYPKSIAEIYRLVTSWQRCHLRKCKNIPPAARTRWENLRATDRSRGKTHYWVTSAKQIGLMDCQSRAGGIRFAPDFDHRTLPAETMLTPSAKEAAEKAAAIAAKAQKIVSLAAANNMAVVPENTEMADAAANAAAITAKAQRIVSLATANNMAVVPANTEMTDAAANAAAITAKAKKIVSMATANNMAVVPENAEMTDAAANAAAIAAKAQKIVSMATANNMAVVPENAEMTDAPKMAEAIQQQ